MLNFSCLNLENANGGTSDVVPKDVFAIIRVYKRNVEWEPRNSLFDMWERSIVPDEKTYTFVEPLCELRCLVTEQGFGKTCIPSYLRTILERFERSLHPAVAHVLATYLIIFKLQCFPILIGMLSDKDRLIWDSITNKGLSVAIVIDEEIVSTQKVERIKKPATPRKAIEASFGSDLKDIWLTQFFRQTTGNYYRISFDCNDISYKNGRTVFL